MSWRASVISAIVGGAFVAGVALRFDALERRDDVCTGIFSECANRSIARVNDIVLVATILAWAALRLARAQRSCLVVLAGVPVAAVVSVVVGVAMGDGRSLGMPVIVVALAWGAIGAAFDGARPRTGPDDVA